MSAHCLGCGAPTPGNYCSECGQKVESLRRPVRSLLKDFFSEFFSLDGRLVRTAALLWRPGRLTQHYVEGRRAAYVSPFRLYLFASLLFFFLVGFESPNAEDFNLYVDDLLIGREEPQPGLTNLTILKLSESGRFTHWLRPRLLAKRDALQAKTAQDLLDDLMRAFERSVPTALICFVPFLALAMKLLYFRRKVLYVDHLVLALHFQSFLFVVLVAARLFDLAGLNGRIPGFLTYVAAFMVAAPPYMIVALRRLHGQSWLKSTVKGTLLGVLYLPMMLPVIVVTVLVVMVSI